MAEWTTEDVRKRVEWAGAIMWPGRSEAAKFDEWLRSERKQQVRFWTRVTRADDETCWLWEGELATNGYGRVKVSGKSRPVHVVTYEWLVGPVPPGLELDHLCRVRRCVNPRHMEPVTHRENTLRGDTLAAANAAKRFCPRGHALVAGNLVPSKVKRRARQCLTCSREMAREYRARKKAANG